jgi:phosphoribosylformylglycinamidine synthase PurS subunit
MPKFKAEVSVSLKPGITDSDGSSAQKTLARFNKEFGVQVGAVRKGNVYTIEIEAPDEKRARTAAEAYVDRLLANPVHQDCKIEIYPVSP